MFFSLERKEYVSGRTVSQKFKTVIKNQEIQRLTKLKFWNSPALNGYLDFIIFLKELSAGSNSQNFHVSLVGISSDFLWRSI